GGGSGATTGWWPSASPPRRWPPWSGWGAGAGRGVWGSAARRGAGGGGRAVVLRAHELPPAAKRVLLEHRGEWTSGEPVVRAMTLGQVDYVLFRPWQPREQFLYLPVSEFLAAWEKSLAPSRCATPGPGSASPTASTPTTPPRAGACSGRPARTAAACRWCCSATAG